MGTWKDKIKQVVDKKFGGSKFINKSANIGYNVASTITEVLGSLGSWFAPGVIRDIKNEIQSGVGELSYNEIYDILITKLQPYINQLDTDELRDLTDALAASATYAKSGLSQEVIDSARTKVSRTSKEASRKKEELIARTGKLVSDIDSFTLSPSVKRQDKVAKEYKDIVYEANKLESDIKKGYN